MFNNGNHLGAEHIMPTSEQIIIWLGLFLSLAFACSAPSGSNNAPVADADAVDSTTDDTRDVAPDTSQPKPYVCYGDILASDTDSASSDFEKPEPTSDGPKTKQEILDDFGGTLPDRPMTYESAAVELAPQVYSMELYASSDQDITLHMGFGHKRDDHTGATLGALVMVDYELVEASFRLMNDDRSGTQETYTGLSPEFPVDEDLELLDIEIPAESFDGTGRFDVSVWVWIGKPDDAYGGTLTTYRLYREGFERPDHPCLTERSPQSATELESQMVRQGVAASSGTTVYPAGATSPAEANSPVRAQPGDELRFNYFVLARTSEPPIPVVLTPIIDDKLGQPIYLVQTTGEFGEIVQRGELRATAPDEPGEYRFTLVPWSYPHVMHGEQWTEGQTVSTDPPYTPEFLGTKGVTIIVE
jgi:hypothetical protein